MIELPEDCELAVREKDGEKYFFALNYGWSEAEIILKRPLADADDGQRVEGPVRLEPFGTKVYRM